MPVRYQIQRWRIMRGFMWRLVLRPAQLVQLV